jgi:hypothetical protein
LNIDEKIVSNCVFYVQLTVISGVDPNK